MPFCLGICWSYYTFVTGIVRISISVSNFKLDNQNSPYENELHENKKDETAGY